MLPSNYISCKNCIYSVKMKDNWMCGKLLKVIEPYQKPCVEGVKRFDTEIFMAKMDSTVQQMDLSASVPEMQLPQ